MLSYRASCQSMMYLHVVRARPVLKVLFSASVMLCNIMWETRHDCSSLALDLAAGLGVRWSRVQVFNAQKDSACCKEHGHKLQFVLGQLIGCILIPDHLTKYKNGRCVLRGYHGDQYASVQFCIRFCQEKYILIAKLCLL